MELARLFALLLAVVCMVAADQERGHLRRTGRRSLEGSTVSCFPTELQSEEFNKCKVLDEEKLALHWKVDDTAKTIKFGVMAPQGVWIAVALPTEGGGLTGSDIVVLKEDKVASRSIFPAPAGFWPANASDTLPTPHPDPNTLTSHKTVNVSSYFVWTRPISACPGATLLADRLHRIYWAVSTMDTWQAEQIPFLEANGYTSDVLTKPAIYSPPDATVVTATMTNAKVSGPGVSLCTLVEVPNDVKYHVYSVQWHNASFEGVQEAALYDCFLQTTLEHSPGGSWDCTQELSLGRCPAVAHYVPGSGILPGTPVLLETLEAAFPVGKGYSEYLVMSVSYKQVPPKGTDSTSGFKLVLSPTLRTNDLGVMVTGAPYSTTNDALVTNDALASSLKVPKGADEVDFVNSCPSACVANILPAGAQMIGARMNMRQLGVSSLVESVTAAGERHTIFYSRSYDPGYPGTDYYIKPVPMDATSSFVTTCVYNSKKAPADAVWGPDLQCLSTIYYMFPRQEKPASGSCFNTLGASLPASLAQYKDKDVALCTIGKDRSFAASTPLESLGVATGIKKNDFTITGLADRNQPICAAVQV